MGVQDRDWWRGRRDRLHPDDPRSAMRNRRTTPAPRGRGRLLLLVLVLMVLGAILWRQRLPASLVPAAGVLQGMHAVCTDPFPAAGAILAGGDARPDTAAVSTTHFINRTPVDRVADLLAGERVVLSIALPALQTSTVRVPAGAYGWRLRQGAAWCAASGVFVREQRTVITNGMQIVPTSMLSIHIEPDASHPAGFALHTSDRPVLAHAPTTVEPASAQPLAGGGLLVPRAADGHYYLDGSIDGQGVRFMIDTGASQVAIPADLARRLGHYAGPDVVSNTANGQATGYAIRVARVAFGPFYADDVRVVALPALDQPLLGMSLLQALELRQTAAGFELRPAR